MHTAPLAVMDYVGPAVGAIVFVMVMSLVAEPTRRTVNAVILGGASGVYLSGGFGPWEVIYPVIGLPIAWSGLRRCISESPVDRRVECGDEPGRTWRVRHMNCADAD